MMIDQEVTEIEIIRWSIIIGEIIKMMMIDNIMEEVIDQGHPRDNDITIIARIIMKTAEKDQDHQDSINQ